MIDLFYWPNANGWKVSIALAEMGLPFKLHEINIGKGDQFQPAFFEIALNNRMPAITDPDGPDGAPISILRAVRFCNISRARLVSLAIRPSVTTPQ